MKSYSEYKNTDINWLGEIPKHWTKSRFKYFLEQCTYPSTNSHKIGLENIESQTGKYIHTNSDFEGMGIAFEKGDIIYGKLRPYLKKVWLAEFSGNAIGDFYVYRFKNNVYNRYIKWMMLSDNFTEIVCSGVDGAKMPRVSSNFINSLEYYLPPISEQKKIADFLDEKTTKIDTLIIEKRSQIQELQAYRSSIITETVTRGLNPHVTLRSSGIDWLGDIPEHWNIVRLGLLFEAKAGGDAKPELYSEFKDETHPYPVFTNSMIESQIYAYTSQPIFRAGSITVTGRGDIGHAFLRKEDFDAIIRLVVLTPSKELCCAYFRYFIDTVIPFFTDSAAVGQLSAAQISKYSIAVPPIDEQKEIAEFLDEKTGKIEELIGELEAQLKDLEDYKRSVITEAVTGKVDVRDWKPKE